ncbi:MAG: hypothetical protein PHI27_09750 [Eubacteriales bacterium]|nr:hypothetical protein [Eubacteriales bacterium]MDD3882526.1 hypothetical protein [Eubacteriales bacterium]MDD4512826.1 hypothetical protein [Eubacteriales bacterium]
MKLIIGAGSTVQEGFVSTQQSELDMLRREDFEKYTKSGEITALLAEHVFEHLTPAQARIAAKNCFDFLASGGYLRAAVPDGFFRNEWYQNIVKVGGNGDPNHPAFTHKVLYNYRTFSALLSEAGFVVELLEYCDEDGEFHYRHWNQADGRIGRSLRFDARNQNGALKMVSVIVDAKKELTR